MKEKPVIYQLLPRLFTNLEPSPVPNGSIERNGCGKLKSINAPILADIRNLGCTHVWLTGVIEHAHATVYPGMTADNPQVVKGLAGSPYAISDYYDIDPDLAVNPSRRIAEFEETVVRIHRAGMKVIIDFVPNHVARRYASDARPADAPADLGADDDTSRAFAPDNNFYYLPGTTFRAPVAPAEGFDPYKESPAKASGNDCFTASPGVNDWYETVKLNYGVDVAGGGACHFTPHPSTWKKMIHILLYWAAKGVDGFRCDMAHMVPVEFWHTAIARVKEEYPDVIFIAELYDIGLYRSYIDYGGFDYLYDKVNLYDTLRDIQTHGRPASSLTDCWWRVDGLEQHMLNFLENHDEQRYASAFYCGDPMRALPALTAATMMGRGAMMIYAGQELGEPGMDREGFSGLDGRTTIFDYWSIGSLRRWLGGGRPSEKALLPRERVVRRLYSRVLGLCNELEAIREGAFFDVMYVNQTAPGINTRNHFVFLRHSAEQTAIVALNFGDTSAEISLNIPEHAFTTLSMTEGDVTATDRLNDLTYTAHLSPSTPFPVYIPACGAAVITF